MGQSENKALLDQVEKVATRAAALGNDIDRQRRLPVDLVDDLIRAGIFRLLVPKSLGGREMAFPDYLTIVERFGRADASTAWCINQAAVAATNAGKTPTALGTKIWGDARGIVANGPIAAQTATPVKDGYLLNGRWNFASGCLHASWIMAFARAPRADGDGEEARQFFIPQNEVEFIDAWQVNGLRGTGSMSFEFQDKFVPKANCGAAFDDRPHKPGPLYKFATHLLFAAGFAATALGAARGGLDDVIELASKKKPGMDKQILRDKQTVQRQIGQAEATWRSARVYLHDAVGQLWRTVMANEKPALELRVQMRVATTHAIRMAEQVIDIAYNVAGSSAIFAENPLQRRFQDVHTITQQIQGRLEHYDSAGRFYLGLTDNLPHL